MDYEESRSWVGRQFPHSKTAGAQLYCRFIGDLSGAVNIVVPFNLTGQAEVQAEGLSVQLESSVRRCPQRFLPISVRLG